MRHLTAILLLPMLMAIDYGPLEPIGLSGVRGDKNTVKDRIFAGVQLTHVGPITCGLGVTYNGKNWQNIGPPIAQCAAAVSTGRSTTKDVRLTGDPNVIHALQVCTADTGSSNTSSIRGVRIWGSKWVDQRPVKIDQRFQVSLPGCDKWHDKLECPDGSVIRALRAHHNDHTYTGLAVSCASTRGIQSQGMLPVKK